MVVISSFNIQGGYQLLLYIEWVLAPVINIINRVVISYCNIQLVISPSRIQGGYQLLYYTRWLSAPAGYRVVISPCRIPGGYQLLRFTGQSCYQLLQYST